MTIKQSKEDDATITEIPVEVQQNSVKSNSTIKLERRRKIEDLNEERRLKKEMCEF